MTVTLMEQRGLPASVDSERSILGAILLENGAYHEAAEKLQAEDFSLDSHRRIYGRMAELIENERAVDYVTLTDELTLRGEVDAVGGRAYIASLTEGLPRRPSIKEYVRIVKEKAMGRQLISLCDSAIARAVDQEKTKDILGSIQDGLESIIFGNDRDEPLVSSYNLEALNEFERERSLKQSPGLSYGIETLDRFTGGMRKGEVCVVGARSGVGKTSLVCQAIAANASKGIPCHLFSLEMTRQQILRRLWSIVSGVSHKRISDPWLATEEDANKVRNAAAEVDAWPLRIHDNSEISLSQIVAAGRLSIRRHGTRFVGVDYAQEVDAPGKDERTKVMMVCRKLSRMVKHEDCSLMLLSQLVKGNREFFNKPPVVSDLVESGKLENVAHCIVLLHRGWDEEAGRVTDEAELIVPKQRRGDTGVKQATFNRRTLTFEGVQ
jgi:replicative DNA helicase